MLASVFLFVTALAPLVQAQSPLPPDPAENSALVHTGPLTLSPRFELLNTGIDWNVFNETENPRKDFTATLRPSLDATLRLSVFRVVAKASLDAVYFQKYDDERALNRSGEVRTEVRLARMVPYFTLAGTSTNERPNNEVDVRAQRSLNTYTAGVALQLFSRTAAVFSVQRQRLAYDPNQAFAGQDLATQFNNDRTLYDGGARIALTDLTTMSILAGREEIRFALSPERDANSHRAGVTFEFSDDAIISGSASLAYRNFDPVSSNIQPFQGVVAQATIRYAYQDRTVMSFRVLRDVDYSIEESEPYYVLNAGNVTVTQRIGGPFDLQGIIGLEGRNYRSLVGLQPASADPKDTTLTVSGGVGYRLGERARIGVNYEYTKRDALNTGRSYDRRRILSSVSYTF
ncbi:MAG TPA: outer membrane beta-barrel protein [Vicinamibacterales bacterium]